MFEEYIYCPLPWLTTLAGLSAKVALLEAEIVRPKAGGLQSLATAPIMDTATGEAWTVVEKFKSDAPKSVTSQVDTATTGGSKAVDGTLKARPIADGSLDCLLDSTPPKRPVAFPPPSTANTMTQLLTSSRIDQHQALQSEQAAHFTNWSLIPTPIELVIAIDPEHRCGRC